MASWLFPSVLALLLAPRDTAAEVFQVAWLGVTVMVEPSGIVVMLLKPFGPDVTLLDMRPDGGGLDDFIALWGVDLDDRDVALADAADDALPFVSAQGCIQLRFAR